MKIYDKEMYNKEKNMKTIVLIIVVFLLGFFTGYIVNDLKQSNNEISTNEIEIVENSNQNNIK
ncbi:MAG: hypothetical protein HFJ40_01075 [Clostridia bacterium]|nr:hypothetical protein [Clostridia bacterium]